MKLEILPVIGIGEIRPGDDLAAAIAAAAPWLRDGDVLVVTSKIVSKAEGRLVDVPAEGPERQAAHDEALTAETARRVARRGQTRIVQTHHGFVLAGAGIDASNVEPTSLVLLPKDPDASARSLRAALRERHGLDVAVIISDTMGRPWRTGQTDVALGVAGIDAIRDHRGEVDPYGNELQVTQMAVADELAAAGDLVKGKTARVPVAVVRGYRTTPDQNDGLGAAPLVRDAEHDLFPLGTAEATQAGMRAAARLADATPDGEPIDEAAVAKAIAAMADVGGPGTVFTLVTDADVRARLAAGVAGWPVTATGLITCRAAAAGDGAELVRMGADLHRLRIALAADGIGSVLLPPPAGSALAAVLAL